MNWFKIAIDESELGSKKLFNDLIINIENFAGTIRYGQNKEDKEWQINMKYDYGFISHVKGKDGEGLDVYIGPNKKTEKVFIIRQNDPKTGKYDEDKYMLGFNDKKHAKESYLEHYDSPDFFGGIRELEYKIFKKYINKFSRKKSKYKN